MLINLSAQELGIIRYALESDVRDMVREYRDHTQGYDNALHLLDRITVLHGAKVTTIIGTELSPGDLVGIPSIDDAIDALTRDYESREG